MKLVIFLLGISSAYALQASVYSLPRSFTNTAWSSLSIDTARHELYRAFGIHDYSALYFQSNNPGISENIWDEKKPRMLIMINGILDPDVLMRDVSPKYHIEDFLYSNVYGELFKTLVEKIEDVKGKSGVVFKNTKGTVIETVPDKGIKIDVLPDQDIFSEFDLEQDLGFVEELTALKQVLQSLDGDVCALIHLSSLGEIYNKYGGQSSQYQSATKLLAGVFSTLLDSQALVVSVPPGQMHVKRGPTERVFVPPSREGKLAYGSCYETRQVCEKVTNNCSEHGSCLEYHGKANCWMCRCTRTVEERTMGEKTSYWTGSSCQVKDTSKEFQLFFWFGVAFLGAIVWGVGLMYSVGNEELGGVFQGVSTHSKKD